MYATVGDRIIIKGHRIGEPDRDCEVIEVGSPDGSPPYTVRWDETGHESWFFPGSDASLHHFELIAAAALDRDHNGTVRTRRGAGRRGTGDLPRESRLRPGGDRLPNRPGQQAAGSRTESDGVLRG